MSRTSKVLVDPQPSCNDDRGYNLFPVPCRACHSEGDEPLVHILWALELHSG